MLQELQDRGYKNVTLLSRGAATELFRPTKRSDTLRTQWGVGPQELAVILVGRLAKEKNVGLVVSAFRAIQEKTPKARLVFVGDGPLKKQLQLSCPDAHFAGVRKDEDLATHYASGDLFLFPSLSETFGNVVPEALASGLAVVAYEHAAAGELIRSFHNGMLVQAGDERSFIQTAVRVSQDEQLQNHLRSNAAPSVSHLEWDAVFNRFVEILWEVSRNRQEVKANHVGVDTFSTIAGNAQKRLSHSNVSPLI
jgi:glycosyltransferase involved in cell wall biosynthesis